MDISVVIPTYNSSLFILDALKSVFAQTYPPCEVIVVDDCSTDDTSLVLSEYLESIVYIKNEKNLGPSASRNIGIYKSRGDWIAFLDSDDVWMPDKLQKQVDYALCNDFSFVISDMYQGNNPDIEKKSTFSNFEFLEEGYIFTRLLKSSYVYTPTVFVKKQLLIDNGCFDESMDMMEDLDLFLKIAYNHKIGIINEILVFRRRHANNISKSFLALDKRALFWKKILNGHYVLSEKEKELIEYQYWHSIFDSAYSLFDQYLFRESRVKFFYCLTHKFQILASIRYIILSLFPKKTIFFLRNIF